MLVDHLHIPLIGTLISAQDAYISRPCPIPWHSSHPQAHTQVTQPSCLALTLHQISCNLFNNTFSQTKYFLCTGTSNLLDRSSRASVTQTFGFNRGIFMLSIDSPSESWQLFYCICTLITNKEPLLCTITSDRLGRSPRALAPQTCDQFKRPLTFMSISLPSPGSNTICKPQGQLDNSY